MRIGRKSSGRQYGSGDGYSLEFFGRDSISFVIQNGQIVDGSSVWRSFAEVDGEVIGGARELRFELGWSEGGRGVRGKWCGRGVE